MEPLRNGQPGPDETWDELAEHAVSHDDVDPARWLFVHPQRVRYPGPRTRDEVAAVVMAHNRRSLAARRLATTA